MRLSVIFNRQLQDAGLQRGFSALVRGVAEAFPRNPAVRADLAALLERWIAEWKFRR